MLTQQVITARGSIETYLGMIELALGIPFGSENSMTAMNFVNAQIDVSE